MSAGDTLASLSEKITDVFTKTFASANPSAPLVFLPFAISPPKDIVQPKSATDPTLVVNGAQMAAFLAANFDEPYLVSTDQRTVHGKDGCYGRLSQIYPLAVTLAQPIAPIGSSEWRTVSTELSTAQSVLTPSGMAYSMACAPEDWVLPGNGSYWSVFDSTLAQPAEPAAASGGGAPHALTAVWRLKATELQTTPSPTLEYLHAVSPPQPAPVTPAARIAPIMEREALISKAAIEMPPAARSVTISSTAGQTSRPLNVARRAMLGSELREPIRPAATTDVAPLARRIPIDVVLRLPQSPPQPAPLPPPPTSSMTMHFEYMSVEIGYLNAGISMWNGVFVANPNWCVPGMTKGGLLPSPAIAVADGQPPLAYGLPVALIVVKNLNISVKWSGQEQASLGASGGFIGPFSLAGATAANASDGSWTYVQPGMQVIALLCTRLPVLPPKDAPAPDSPA